jgi:hypothetical protein
MTTYEQCMKASVMLHPLALNRQSHEGQGMQGHGGNDYTMDVKEASSGCGR